MIRSITQQKTDEEIDRLLGGSARIFIIGCGTCSTLTRTGGEPEVLSMKEKLSDAGRMVTGRLVAPVACDNLTGDILGEIGENINQADALLVMSCGGCLGLRVLITLRS